MSEQTQNNQTLIIALVVVAVLMAAIVGIIVYQQSTAVPPVTATPTAPVATDPAAGAPAGMGGATGGSTTPAEVDPSKATEVPKGTEPQAYVEAYYKACDEGDWQAAFDALPVDKKAGNSADALKAQVSGYGVEGFKVTSATTEGDTTIVKVDQVTGSYGTFENTWTFVKKDGKVFVASKAVTGMK